jgi:hypothetical protein
MISGASANVKDFGAVGDGVANDTAAIAAAIASGARSIVFPSGTYLTTGNVIPADSNIAELIGLGRPTLKRQGQGIVATGINLTILAVYKNKLKISGFNIDGNNQAFSVPAPSSTVPPDRTWYADIAVLTAVGSPAPTQATDNFCLITDCYFRDAPGNSVAGSQMQNCIVTGCKFDGWFDHAVYASGATAAVSNDIIVSNNIFTQARYNGGFAVKLRNRVTRYVVSNNTFDMGAVPPSVASNGAIVFDQGNGDPALNYKPTSMVINGNAGKTGIFFSMNTEFTVQNPAAIATVQITGNNIRSDQSLFYIAETAGSAWAAHMNIVGNSFYNEAGIWKVLLDFRFVNSTYENTVVFSDNLVFDYALMQVGSVYPQTTRILNNRFNRSYARFFESLGTDDATAKVLEFQGNHFVHDTNTAKGAMVLRPGANSTLVFRDNYFKNNASLAVQSQPKRIEVIGNVFEDSTGLDFGATFSAIAPRASVGELFLERNKAISTIGSSAIPRLLNENTATPSNPVLASYKVYAVENYFKDVSGGLVAQGNAITGYAGANTFYGVNNYGTGSTVNVQYPGGSESATLPVIAI